MLARPNFTYPKRRERWAVIGGGFLGMTLALRLAQQGKAVTLFESAPVLGGLASAWQLGDIVWDRHYHVILQSDSFLLSLLREIGVEDELRWATTRTGFYVDSRLHSLSNSLEFLQFPPLSLASKLRLGATIFYASRIQDWKALEKIPVEAWLERCSGRAAVDKIWRPLLRAKLGDNYRETSAAFIWATIARMYAARRSGMKREMFGYVAGGYARIIVRLASLLRAGGVRFRLGEPVRRILRSRQTGSGASSMHVEREAGEGEIFDQVVVTAAAPLAARLCPQLSAGEKVRLSEIRHQGIVCASLLLKRSLSNFYITNITDPGLPYTAVIEMSALVDRDEFAGHSLVYLPRYVPSDSADFLLTDNEIQGRFLRGLERMYPEFRRDDLLSFQVSRVKYLLPIPTIGYSDRLPAISTSVPGLHIVSSAHIVNGTLNVNQTVQLAESAASHFAGLPNHRDCEPHTFEYDIPETARQPVA